MLMRFYSAFKKKTFGGVLPCDNKLHVNLDFVTSVDFLTMSKCILGRYGWSGYIRLLALVTCFFYFNFLFFSFISSVFLFFVSMNILYAISSSIIYI